MTPTKFSIIAAFAISGLGFELNVPDASAAPTEAADDTKFDAEAIRKELESRDEPRILAALEKIGQAEQELALTALPHVEALLRRGSSVQVVTSAFKVAGKLGQQSSSPVVALYVRHRQPELRRAAVEVLVKTKGPAAVSALRQALRSRDPVVRSRAASGLGKLKAPEAVPDLLRSLDHRVDEAAEAIGSLCTKTTCPELTARLGKIPLEVITRGFDALLFRSDQEIPEDLKLEVVHDVQALATPAATQYLISVAKRWPKDANPEVRKALIEAIDANGGKLPESS